MGNKVNENLIKFLAKLGKITLTDKQVKSYSVDLEEIITYVSMVGQMQTQGVNPRFHTTNKKNTFQDKKHPKRTLSIQDVLSNAKQVKNNMFVVPRIISK